MKNKSIFLILLFAGTISFANNLQISGIAVNQTTQNITFTLTWDNSWNVAAAPANWDAAWVFVKWRLCTDGDAIAFTHGALSSVTADHTYTNLTAMTTVDGTVYTQSIAEPVAMDKTDGIMLKPTAAALGSITSNVSLKITNLPPAGTDITLSVFGIEMVYIPQGNYKLGDGDGLAAGALSRFSDGTLLPASLLSPSVLITSGYETGGALSTFYLNVPAVAPGTTISAVPLAFPKGQFGFYIMKYEISEGLYAEFLNSLGYNSAAATARYPANYTTNRNQLNGTVPPYVAGRSDRAQNWLSWADVGAFLDWACLRPMTELEFEKASRGPAASVLGEYAWGTTVITTGLALTFGGAAVENGTETTTAGNCIYGNAAATFSNGDAGQGPGRAGLFATASSTRVTAGASYYGVMELSGNLREPVVAMVADVPGAAGSGVTNVFTRSWGNGSVTAAGIHPAAGTTANWPASAVAVANTVVTNLVGHRGGSWNNAIAQIQISDRNYIYNAPVVSRQAYNGGRGIR